MGYGRVARLLHWITVLLVLVMIPVGLTMTQEGLPKAVQDPLFILHKSLGPLVLLTVLFRVGWRLFHPPTPMPASVPPLQRRAATTVHALLYAVLIIMGVSGYVRVTTGGFPIELLNALGIPPLFAKNEPVADVAEAVHATAKFGLLALIAIHVAAAAYHGIVRRDGVISRIWPPFYT